MKKTYDGKKRNVWILLWLHIIFSGVLLQGANVTLTSIWKSSLQVYTDVCVSGRYIYCAANPGGLTIFDGQNPNQPVLIGHLDLPDVGASIQVIGKYAFLTTYPQHREYTTEMNIVDISNPAAPHVVGRYLQRGWGLPLHVNGQYACFGHTIIDISNPMAPFKVSELGPYFYSDTITLSAVAVFMRDKYVYVLDSSSSVDGYNIGTDIKIFDISNPAKPVRVGYYSFWGDYIDMHVAGNYIYVWREDLKIIDISNPTAPVLAGQYDSPCFGDDFFVSGNNVYHASRLAEPETGWRLQVLDISSKQSPIIKGEYTWTGRDTMSPLYFSPKVFVEGDFAYIVVNSNRLKIVNISNPTAPQGAGSYVSTGMPNAQKIILAGHYAYLLHSPYLFDPQMLMIYDISNPLAPVWKSTFQLSQQVNGFFVSDHYVYLYHYSGIFIVNITNPSAPVLASHYTTSDTLNVRNIYVSGSQMYVADSYSGLLILDISVPVTPLLKGTWNPGVSPHAVTVEGNYAFILSINSLGPAYMLSVLDITNPAAPLLVNEQEVPWGCNQFFKNGHFLFLRESSSYQKAFVYDISNPTQPKFIDDSSPIKFISDIAFIDAYAYVLEGQSQVAVYDISNIADPVLVGYYHTDRPINSITLQNRLVFLGGAEILRTSTTTTPPILQVNQKNLYFTAQENGPVSSSQALLITNGGGGNLSWALSKPQSWLICTPLQGSTAGALFVSADNFGLAAGVYTQTITISSPMASNSPQTVTVTFTNTGGGTAHAPFGTLDTPLEGATVSGSIAITGWALDEQEIKNVQLLVENHNTLTYIGDAIFVYGARPDVQERYPTYPNSASAGWGYMLLTHFLPRGDGTYTIHAVATNQSGTQTTLGARTITVDNAHATQPFGAIDTPAQGGRASGKTYINYGWALTPTPNTIPTNGSTIQVWVDGVAKGSPVYNLFRVDIATLFPGYHNTIGAVGYFTLDTTPYSYGLHTLQWSVTDNAGNTDGIGSRYFVINNLWGDATAVTQDTPDSSTGAKELLEPETVDPVFVTRGYSHQTFNPVFPDKNGVVKITMAELERIEAHFETSALQAISTLPIGSTLDTQQGIFYWQPGAGFIGTYTLDFSVTDGAGKTARKSLAITIDPTKLKDSPQITQIPND